MTPLIPRFRERLAFDEDAFSAWLNERMRNDYEDPSPYTCAEWQSQQNAEVIACLIECVAALEDYEDLYCQIKPEPKRTSNAALANLERLVEGEK